MTEDDQSRTKPKVRIDLKRDRQYPKLRRLDAVVDSPVLVSGGRVLDRNGYDEASGICVRLSDSFPRVPREPLHGEAVAAAQRLLAVLQDIPFVSAADRSGWLCALLTAASREAFGGNAPLFAVTGNSPGCGKTMLTEIIGLIVAGRGMATIPPAQIVSKAGITDVDDSEMRKRITSLVLEGSRLVVIDNAQVLGGASLLAALTCCGAWSDRILNTNQTANGTLRAVLFATGNNLLIGSEMRRRTVLIRLATELQDPSRRADFAEPHLLEAVASRRGELLVDALTILCAYWRAGSPSVGISRLGSFEQWSDLVRSAVVWLGLPDPLEVPTAEAEMVDHEAMTLQMVLAALEPITRFRAATTKQILEQLDKHEKPVGLEAAIGELVASNRPTPSLVSHALRRFCGRVHGGLKLAAKPTNAGLAWSVVRVPAPLMGDGRGDRGEGVGPSNR